MRNIEIFLSGLVSGMAISLCIVHLGEALRQLAKVPIENAKKEE